MNKEVIENIMNHEGNAELVDKINNNEQNYNAVKSHYNWKQWKKITEAVGANQHDCIWAMINYVQGEDADVAGI